MKLYSQTEFIVKYLEINNAWGTKNTHTLNVKNNLAKFTYHQKEEEKVLHNGIKINNSFKHYETYFNLKTKEIVEQAKLKDGMFLISEWSVSDMKWDILKETKTIKGYKVQKAITKSIELSQDDAFYFGDAIAWFATDIPIPLGPNRYCGLPGLIIEIRFSSFGTIYTLDSIDYILQEKINIPNTGIRVSKEQIIRNWEISKQWLKKQKKK